LSLSVTFVGTKERVGATRTAQGTGFLTNLKSIMKLPEFRVVLAMFLLNMVGFDLVQVVLIFFLKHVIKVSDDLVFVFMAIPLVVAVLSAPLWVLLGQKWGKKNAFIIAAVYLFVSFLLCLVVPEGNVVFMGVLCAFAGIGVSASQVIPFSIIPDIIEIDEYENGTRREGAFYGVTMFLYKAASAIAINVATLFLAAFGYMEAAAGQTAEEVAQPESAVWAIRILMGVGPGVCFLLAAAFVKKLSITKERFEEVRLALEERNNN
jgi:GPH family glycoside/pentoside/hexuronide:cation symporter